MTRPAIGDSSIVADRKARAHKTDALADAFTTNDRDMFLGPPCTGPPSTEQDAGANGGPATPKNERGTTAAEAGWLSAHRAIISGNRQPAYVSLDVEIRATLNTDEAAFHLGRAAQTLRVWASRENGPLLPIRINGRLAWPVAELRRLLGLTPMAAK